MPKFNEDTLTNWTKPVSDHEDAKLATAHKYVKEAIDGYNELSDKSIEIFAQGSYANDTNVRLNSDIDVNVLYTGGFYFKLPPNKTREDYGLTNPSKYSFEQYKDDVENALVQKFGRRHVVRNDKCFTISEDANRVETDVVPTWNFRRYDENKKFVQGVKFKRDTGDWIENFPKQHIENAIEKNKETSKRFKRLTRLYRKIRYRMIDENVGVSDHITSFLLECLVWNVPDNVFNDYETWTERLRESIIFLYNATKTDENCSKWGEVSELLYLFHSGRKWNRDDVHNYLLQLWRYLEFK